jgi:hypothetical protein
MRRAYALLALAFVVAAYFAARRGRSSRSSESATSTTGATGATRATTKPASATRAPRAAPPIAHGAASRRLATLGWGDGPGQVGRRHDPESVAEGPMALTSGRDGSLYVLDEVHGRVLRRRPDGSYAAPIAIGDTVAQDLRADAHGLAVLDRAHDRSLLRIDDGKTSSVPLSSLGVVDPGGVTGLFADDRGELYVEESLAAESRRVVYPVAGGAPLIGRPSRDGAFLLSASIGTSRPHGPRNVCVVRALSPSGGERFHVALWTPAPIIAVVLLDSDDAGNTYVGAITASSDASSHDLVGEALDLFRVDGNGDVVGQLEVAHPPSPYVSFRELEVAGVGVVWWMHAAPDGNGVVVDELTL